MGPRERICIIFGPWLLGRERLTHGCLLWARRSVVRMMQKEKAKDAKSKATDKEGGVERGVEEDNEGEGGKGQGGGQEGEDGKGQ